MRQNDEAAAKKEENKRERKKIETRDYRDIVINIGDLSVLDNLYN